MIKIIGAGMAGLLAGAVLRKDCKIYEAASSLPNNHHALLRFRNDAISQQLNIPFTPVDVIKIIKPFRNKVAEVVGYSIKSGGRASLRSIRSAQGNVDRRFIAPPDFIQQLEALQSEPVTYNFHAGRQWIEESGNAGPIISTIPMGSLMDLLGYKERASFTYRHGWVVKGTVAIPSDLCATIYYPDPALPIVRATLTSDLIQIEMVDEFDQARWDVDVIMQIVLQDFGMEGYSYFAEMVPQRYAKIVAIPQRERVKFILWATDQFNVYSLGRYAIWKPNLLLDEVLGDIQKIQSMINDGHNYDGRLPTATN